MSREGNKKIHNIYLLDKSRIQQGLSVGADTSPYEIAAQIMAEGQNYKIQRLKEGLNTTNFSIALYFRKEDYHQNKFASFCATFVAQGEDAVTFFPRSSSSVLFVWNSEKIYAITTGQGFRMVEKYLVPNFGLIIASAFEERFKITSLDSNAMSSIVHSTKTIYSNEVDFIDIESLDTIFKEITGRLKDADKVQSLLNLNPSSKKKSMKITAKNYVQFSSSLNFKGLLHLLGIVDEYDINNLRDRFNLITPMTLKKNCDTITANNAMVIHLMYEAITVGRPFPFDLFHKETNVYISADSYTIYDPTDTDEYTTRDDHDAMQLVLDAFKNYLNGKECTEDNFYTFATSVNLCARKGDDIVTDGTLLQHISGEICVNNTNYYVFYGEYYRLNVAYNDRLKASLRGKLRPEFYTSEIRTKWLKKRDEDWFNLTVSINEGYIHLHRIKPEYIEFCDLLKCDDDTVTIVHVKDGFDGEMRILDRQVELSITKILDLKHNNNGVYMQNLYQKAAENDVGKNITTVFKTEQDFWTA